MRVSDLIVGLLVLVGAAALYAAASTFPPIPGQQYGADVFPTLTAAGLAACGLLLCLGSVRAGPFPLAQATWIREPGALPRALATIALTAAYLVLAPLLGFLLAASLVLTGLFVIVNVRLKVAVPVALATALVTWWSFAHGLRVPLPRGLIEGYL
ncbi:tripartite tricarboxylate transporter TctB family protein [Xanthobacter pseudotagetidis]|uniref:tripartite tricarboxylate transporter TctB family protein n=1 Tax=Xanthobacter pseudotagetidis TaxID=3119911 RepID=UPI003729062E